jgi:CDP-glucose 4,6-dehydratase
MAERKPTLESVVTPAFWKDRRVFVTGHTGFKGAWLVALLHHLGARVTGYSLAPPTQPSLYQWAHLDELVVDKRADIRDLSRLRAVFQHAQAEIVIHLAAQSLVRASYRDPVSTYETNVIGTANLLDAVYRERPHVAPRVALIVTTDKVYRHGALDRPLREDDPLGGQADPYSTSKACAEMVAAQYVQTLGERCAILTARAGNVIGGGDFADDRILPDAVRAFSHGETLALRYPQAVRPWQHVLDPLIGYLTLCERSFKKSHEFSGAWNFGPDADHEWSVEELVQEFARHWPGAAWQWQAGLHPPETHMLRLDSSKARQRLDWQCRLPMEEALRWSADFYQAMARGADVRALMQQQIEDYLAKCASF